jgi:LDH2 family malate/lactate/ureidoglycolate dehydrogenase
MEVAIRKAKESGVSVVSTFNCQHIGRMADYAEMALEHDMIGIVLANTGPLGTAYGGMGPILGTNPISYAIPTKEEEPFILDFATTVAPVGKVMVKHARGEDLPSDWALDENGTPTTKTSDLFSPPPNLFPLRGSLLPFGGSVAYKGFGLCLMVDILGGLISGAGTGTARADDYGRFAGGNGCFMMAIDISRFQDVETFKGNVDKVFRNVKAMRKAPGEYMNMEPGEILVPGDPERRREAKNRKEGIYVEDSTWNRIADTAKNVGLDVEKIK